MIASLQDRLYRAEICHACPNYIRMTKQCRLCGCIITLKISGAAFSCPDGKWGPVESKFLDSVSEVFITKDTGIK